MSSNHQFTKLLEPGKIGHMTIKNRMIMPAMATMLGTEEGYVTQRSKDYYAARAMGGIGLIITEFVCVDAPEGRASCTQLIIDDDKFIPGMKELAETIHQYGTKAALQIHHAGRRSPSAATGKQPVAPSPIPDPDGETPRQLTESEIARLVECFADAALRAQKSGFDGVEIHGAHGYLVSQFLSAASNQRQDKYGGSLENRARFLLEIFEAIRAEVGRDYPVWCRLSGNEIGLKNGITIEETKQVAQWAQEAEADAIHVSAHAVGPRTSPPMAQRPGVLLPLAEAVKSVVSLPVITVSRMEPTLGETALQEGKADFIAFGRPLLADPDYANKVASEKLDEIKPCIYCNNCLDRIHISRDAIFCTVNPALGHEQEYSLTKSPRSKKVIVVGGGPAGMEAARVAASRGHRVQLYEKGEELGGQLLLAQILRHKQTTIGNLIRYLTKETDKQGIEVHLSTEATADLILRETPDAVILATGILPLMPDISGVELGNVVLATDVLTGRADVGNKVTVIGGELVGCEVAIFLADAGKKVTLMRRGVELALKVNPFIREPLLHRLSNKYIFSILTGIQYREITADGVVIIDKDGRIQTVEADTIVIAAGAKPNNQLLALLKEKVAEVYTIGDCIEPRSIMEAMREGYQAGLSL